jgi:hypothetical protein
VTADPPSSETTETSAWQPAVDGGSQSPTTTGSSPQERAAAIANERPEVAVGAAFAGGLLFALILKRLVR